MPVIKVTTTKELLDVLEDIDLYDVANRLGWEDEDPRFNDFIKLRNDVHQSLGVYDHPYEKAALDLEQQGYEAEYRPEYSGRGMFGTTCPALVSNAPYVIVGMSFAKAGVNPEQIPLRSDTMGRNGVVYY